MTNGQISEIANFYGEEHQTKKLIEELGELIKAIVGPSDDAIIEEVADVKLMLAQMEYLLGIGGKVDDAMSFKVRRTLEQIDRMRANGRTRWEVM